MLARTTRWTSMGTSYWLDRDREAPFALRSSLFALRPPTYICARARLPQFRARAGATRSTVRAMAHNVQCILDKRRRRQLFARFRSISRRTESTANSKIVHFSLYPLSLQHKISRSRQERSRRGCTTTPQRTSVRLLSPKSDAVSASSGASGCLIERRSS